MYTIDFSHETDERIDGQWLSSLRSGLRRAVFCYIRTSSIKPGFDVHEEQQLRALTGKNSELFLTKLINSNQLMGILKPSRDGPLHSNTVIGTLAVDGCLGWAVTFGTGPWRAAAPPSPLIAVSNLTAHQSTACVPTSMWHCNYLSHILFIEV